MCTPQIQVQLNASSQNISHALFMIMFRVGQNHTYIIYGVYTVFLAGKSPNIRSYMVYVYGPGQPYLCF